MMPTRSALVVCAGLKKSGSAWWFHLMNRLVVESGGSDVHDVVREFGLERVLVDDNARLGSLRVHRLGRLARPMLAGRRFAVKTHAPPRPAFGVLARTGRAVVFLSVRDPRDMALSALDHGRRNRDEGRGGVLAELVDLDDAVGFVRDQVELFHRWRRVPGVAVIRYEDVLADPVGQVTAAAVRLGTPIDERTARSVVDRVDTDVSGRALHRNVGAAGRFAAEVSPEERLRLAALDDLARALGYSS